MLLLDLVSYQRSSHTVTGSNIVIVLQSYHFIFERNQVVVSFNYDFYAAIFNEDDFENSGIDPGLVRLGKILTEEKSTDIYLPSLSSQELK